MYIAFYKSAESETVVLEAAETDAKKSPELVSWRALDCPPKSAAASEKRRARSRKGT